MLGLLLTAGATGLSVAIALLGFRNEYYLAPMLPAFMVLYILLAWLMHIRLGGLGATALLKDPAGNPDAPAADGLRDENGLVRRRPVPQEAPDSAEKARRSTIAALVWSAAQLAIVATVLYHFFGVGATYFPS